MSSGTLPADLARRVRLVVLDVDGVLTDGGVYMGAVDEDTPVEFKRFEITDQLGIKMLMWAGIEVVFVSGRESPATRIRADELGVESVQASGGHKMSAVQDLLERRGIGWDRTALVADDLADLPAFRRVGLPVAVANAVPEMRAAAAWMTGRAGGDGAAREFAEAVLRARGEWSDRVEQYCRDRGGTGEGARA